MNFRLKKRLITFSIPPYKKRISATFITIVVFLILLLIGFYIMDFRIRPSLIQMAQVKARLIATRAINESIRADISPNIEYQNLIKMQYDQNGKLSLIQPNTGVINRIASEATLAVQKHLQSLPKEKLLIPLGQIAGSKILAGYGPGLVVKVLPIGFVESKINDHFDVAGINQVRHRVYITVEATVKLVIPLVNEEIHVSSDIPLVEAIIMGEVPDVYVGNGGVILPGNTNN